MDVSRKGASTTSWKPLPLTSIPDKKQLSRIRNGCAARGSYTLTHSDDASEKSKICSEGEKRILAFAYFLSEIEEKQNSKIIVIDDPITSLDLSRKSVIAYRIGELFRDNNDQVIVMTHDIAFVEQILEFSGTMKENVSMMELKNRENIFYPLEIKDYLMSDEMVYKSFITNAMVSNNESDRIIGLMSLRPYTSIVNSAEYSAIEKESTYCAHTVYAHNAKRNIKYDENIIEYFTSAMRKIVELNLEMLKEKQDDKEDNEKLI